MDKVSTQMCHAYNILFMCSPVLVNISVPDPKLIISDPDPHIENQEFRIRSLILDPDPSVTRDGEKKLSILVIRKTQMG